MESVEVARRTGENRFIVQVTLNVHRQGVGRFVAAGAGFLQGFHDDPIEVATKEVDQSRRVGVVAARGRREVRTQHRAQPCRGTLRFFLANGLAHFVQAGRHEFLGIEWCLTGEQFVEQNAQRVNVTARVNIQPAHLGLFRTHVGRCADKLLEGGKERLIGQSSLGGFGDAKVNDLGYRHAVVQGDEDIRGFDVAMDDALLVSMLDGVADLDEQLDPVVGGKLVLVAILGDLDAPHQFHDKIRPARLRRAGVKDSGDVGMIHEGEGLTLGLETGDDALGIHAELDDLEGDASADRFVLLSHIDHATAPFADLLEDLVAADLIARSLGYGQHSCGQNEGFAGGGRGRLIASTRWRSVSSFPTRL